MAAEDPGVAAERADRAGLLCTARPVSPSFYAWRRELAQRRDQTPEFVPVQMVGPSAVGARTSLEVVLDGGPTIRVAPGFDAATSPAHSLTAVTAPCFSPAIHKEIFRPCFFPATSRCLIQSPTFLLERRSRPSNSDP